MTNKNLFKNISWVFLERIGQVVGSFIISGLVSRQLGVSAYGDFQYVLSLILVFSSVGLLCSSEVLLPKLSEANRLNTNKLIAAGFILRLCSASVAYVILFAYSYLFEKDSEIFFLMSAIGLTLFLREPFAVFAIYYQSLTNSKPVVVASMFVLLVKTLILTAAFWFDSIDFALLSVVWIFEAAGLALIFTLLYFKNSKNLSVSFKLEFSNVRKIAREGISYMLPLVLVFFFLKIDKILVRNISSNYEAGIYMAGMQLFDAAISLATIASVALAPSLIYQNFSHVEIRRNMQRLLLIMLFLGFSISIVGYYSAPFIILSIFGLDFIESVAIAQIAFFISILAFIDAALSVYLIKKGDSRFALIKWLLVIVIALPVEYFAIVFLGAQAAQMGIAAGYISAIAFGVYRLKGDYVNNDK